MIAVNPSSWGTLPALVEGLPNICGWESEIDAVAQAACPVFLPRTNLRLKDISAGFAIALHMHQPTIPAGSQGELISNLQYMFEHPYEEDNYNAAPFAYCYARLGDFIPELVGQGCNPRVMLDYSGELLWGLQQIGRQDILDKLRLITCDPVYQPLCGMVRNPVGTCGRSIHSYSRYQIAYSGLAAPFRLPVRL